MEHTFTVHQLDVVESDLHVTITLGKLLNDYPYTVAEDEVIGKIRVIALCVNERDAHLLRDALTMLDPAVV
ncbi:hypothetical protein LCGC14_2773350 [marine sediment metagenome]|uniref:Uncharacterized protein n=1 Tax=marine sediment metagenome TaxID=412755 RepID=A0A0F8ZHE1_9ZZZZ